MTGWMDGVGAPPNMLNMLKIHAKKLQLANSLETVIIMFNMFMCGWVCAYMHVWGSPHTHILTQPLNCRPRGWQITKNAVLN